MARVLVVDDVVENITIVKDILKAKYDVVAATSGEKALEMLTHTQNLPDLILLDVVMPGIDGFEVCKRIKENDETKHIPVIFLTILDNINDVVHGFKYGAVDYITKPFDVDVLLARVDTHIRLKQHEDDLINIIKEKDQILLQQSKLATLGEMFEIVTHQWKQPLSVISMTNVNIRTEQEFESLTAEKLQKFLDAIDNSTNHLAKTVDVFRDFLQVDQNDQYFSIKAAVEQTLNILESKIKNNFINVNQPTNDIEVYGKKSNLIQALMNIISNSITALEKIDSDRQINIDLSTDKGKITITICDNGGGIPKEYIEKIFEKYFTTKQNKIGAGVGLYVAKIIVEDNFLGKITPYNNENGACFEITFENHSPKSK